MYCDKYFQLQGELNHAGALRATYARQAKYGLNKYVYYKPQEPWGQLPLVPASSIMLAPLDGTTNEDKVGAKIFRDADLALEFQQAMRFTDQTLIDILNTMRVPGAR